MTPELKAIGTAIAQAISALRKELLGLLNQQGDQIKELDLRVKEFALVEVRHGKDGKDGENGRDGESIKGDKGDKGDPGESIKGETGDRGLDGIGKDGENGKDGAPGEPGVGIFTKQWAPGICREGVIVQHHAGQFFKALRDTNCEPFPCDGENEDWERVGTLGFRFAKGYAESRKYLDGDLFVKDFSLFMQVNGQAKLVAGRGQKGDRGEIGKTGKDGVGLADILVDDKNFGLVFVQSDGVTKTLSLASLIRAIDDRVDTLVLVKTAEYLELSQS